MTRTTEQPGTLLVVDDEDSIREMLVRRLELRGHSVTHAAGGLAALEALRRESFDVVILDIMMPNMSGLEVLQRIRQDHSAVRVPVIMATALDQSEMVAQALSLGANDYVTKPFDFEIVAARVNTQIGLQHAVKEIIDLEEHLARRNNQLELAHRQLTQANARMKSDLDAAAELQRSLLPEPGEVMNGVTAAWQFQPCEALAGDIFNIFPLGDSHIAMYALDVSGHGVRAALLSVTLSRMLSPVADRFQIVTRRAGPDAPEQIVSPADVALHLNRLFPLDSRTLQFFTMHYGVLDTTSGEYSFASAGHPPPILLRSGGEARYVPHSGYPIGVTEDPRYELGVLQLQPGDSVIAFSDGLFEAANDQGAQFGLDRMKRALCQDAVADLQERLRQTVEAARQWCGENGLRDDLSIVGLTRR